MVVDPFDPESVLREVAAWHEGHVVSAIHQTCNERASNWGYVAEYSRWREIVVEAATAQAAESKRNPLRGDTAFTFDLPYDVQPARMVRQVIGMFMAVQSTEHLLADHPVLADLIGPEPTDASRRRQGGLAISPLHLYVSVCDANWSYLTTSMMSVTTTLRPSSRL